MSTKPLTVNPNLNFQTKPINKNKKPKEFSFSK